MIDFEKRQRERQQKIDAWTQAAEEIREQLDALEDSEQDATAAGDPDRLAGIIADRRALTDRLDAYNRMIEHCPPPWTDAEIMEAWTETAADHNQKFSKLYAKYVKTMRQLFDQYLELADMQHTTGRTYAVMRDRMTVEAKRNGFTGAKIDHVPVFEPKWRKLLAPVMTDRDPLKDSELSQRASVPLDIMK